MITYGKLKDALSPEQLDCDAMLYDAADDEYYSLAGVENGADVLDDKHPILIHDPAGVRKAKGLITDQAKQMAKKK